MPFSLFQQVRFSSLSDDLHKMRIRTVFFIAVMILHKFRRHGSGDPLRWRVPAEKISIFAGIQVLLGL